MTIAYSPTVPTSPMASSLSRKRGMWPAPVYIAEFADGTIGRHSFFSPVGKPLDFDRGRAGAAWLWRKGSHPVAYRIEAKPAFYSGGRPTKISVPIAEDGRRWSMDTHYSGAAARVDMIAGYVEVEGQRIEDPHFSGEQPAKAKAPPKASLADAIKLLQRTLAQDQFEWSEDVKTFLARAA